VVPCPISARWASPLSIYMVCARPDRRTDPPPL
jgi:hypothetical protein